MRSNVLRMLPEWIQMLSISVIAVNGMWFLAAFRLFSLQNAGATRVLFVNGADREAPLADSLAALLRFLGGMNGALAFLCGAVVVLEAVGSSLFGDTGEVLLILLVLGVANFTQFWFNVLVRRSNAADPATLWPVTTGLMRQIFIGDVGLTALDLGIAVLLVTNL